MYVYILFWGVTDLVNSWDVLSHGRLITLMFVDCNVVRTKDRPPAIPEDQKAGRGRRAWTEFIEIGVCWSL